jgi:colicin import membrane protein
MPAALREHSLPLLWSVLLHGALALGIVLAAKISFEHPPQVALGPSVDAVAVDSKVLKDLQDRKQAQADARERKAAEERQREQDERDRAQAEERAKAAAQVEKLAEQAAAEKAAAAQAAATHAAEQRAATAQAATLKAQATSKAAAAKAAAAEKLNAVKQQSAAKARAAAADEQTSADAKAAAAAQDAKLRAQRESELRRQLADEEHLSALQSGPLQKSYIASIQNRITRAWLKPASARPGIVCKIEVTQVAGGEVTKVRVIDCNGDEAVRQSIENAVYRASPLPEPPDPALFQRNLTLVFKPNE